MTELVVRRRVGEWGDVGSCGDGEEDASRKSRGEKERKGKMAERREVECWAREERCERWRGGDGERREGEIGVGSWELEWNWNRGEDGG